DRTDPAGLVLDVLLVEARIYGQRRRREGTRVLGRGDRRVVRGEELHLHVERAARQGRRGEFPVDRIDREVRVDVGRIVVPAVGLVDAVLVEGEGRVGRGRADEAVELTLRRERAPTGRNVGIALALREAVRHLADVDRPVAGAMEPDRQVVFVVEALVAALR